MKEIPLTIESLARDIQAARLRFERLNRRHWRFVPQGGGRVGYHALPLATEKRIVALAERIERLSRFAGILSARDFSQV